MSSMKTSRTGSIVAFTLSAIFVTAALWVFLNRQLVLDQISVWSYAPSSRVAAINSRVQFTNKGGFVFYATNPSVAQQADFNKECPRQETASPILGCYTNDDHIFIYDLTNEKLDGMEEVTAAHEMLHAVWYRTSDADKEKLTTELKAAYGKIDNSELRDRMDYYQRTEPGEFINELHSILGTEVGSLGEPLESYYSQFFNRSAVLQFHQQYSAVYKQLYDRADVLYATMQTLSTTIQDRSKSYDAEAAQLSADINSFNTRANNNSFTSQSQFNNERNALIRRTTALDVERTAINAEIDTYNGYYSEYEDISKQIEVLNNSIDSFKQIDQAPSV
ncbi:MAG: hypothetical protein ACOH18_02005 [Candidatus Saccharimonadaceae bacterium]